MIGDYALRAFCCLVIAMFVWLVVGVTAVMATGAAVSLPHVGLLVLWLCTFAAAELKGVWR